MAFGILRRTGRMVEIGQPYMPHDFIDAECRCGAPACVQEIADRARAALLRLANDVSGPLLPPFATQGAPSNAAPITPIMCEENMNYIMKLVDSAPVKVPPDPLADAVDLVVRQVADVVRRVAELEDGYRRLLMDMKRSSGGPAIAEKGARVSDGLRRGVVLRAGAAGVSVKWDDGSEALMVYGAFDRLRAAT